MLIEINNWDFLLWGLCCYLWGVIIGLFMERN